MNARTSQEKRERPKCKCLFRLANSIRRLHQDKLRFEVKDAHPEIASAHGEGEADVDLPDRKLCWTVTLDVRSDKTNFYYKFRRRLRKNGQVIREKTWQETIPRDHQ